MGGVTGRSSNVPGHGSNHRAGRCAPEVPGSSCPSPSPVANGWPTPGQFSAVTAWPVLSPQILWRRCRSDFSWKGSRPRELPAVIRLGERISRQAVAPRLCCEGQGSRSIHGLAERDHVAAFQPGPVDADGRGHAEILRRPQLAVRNLFRGLAVGPGKRRQEDESGTRRAVLGRGLLQPRSGFGRPPGGVCCSRIRSTICSKPGRPREDRSSAAAATIRCDAAASRPDSLSLARCGDTRVITWSCLRAFQMQEKPPPGRTTCPSCSNRCGDGGQTGLRVRLVFALRGGVRPPAAVWQVGSWTGEAGARRPNRAYLSFTLVFFPSLVDYAATRPQIRGRCLRQAR